MGVYCSCLKEEPDVPRTSAHFNKQIQDYVDRLVKEQRLYDKHRNPHMRNLLIPFYGTVCQACGRKGERTRGGTFLECAHIQPIHPVDKVYLNHPRNLLILCPSCHTMFDNGLPDVSQRIQKQVKKRYPHISYMWVHPEVKTTHFSFFRRSI